jgi:hypothetical protein
VIADPRRAWESRSRTRAGDLKRPIDLAREVAGLTRKLIGTRMEGHLFWDRHAETWTTGAVCLLLVRLSEGDRRIRLVV